MKITIAEPKYLKDSIGILSDLVNEGQFKITKDAVELVAMDPANVAMVIFKLFSSSFIDYNVKEDVKLGVNLSELNRILRRAKSNDMVTLELEQDGRLKVQLKSGTTRTFSLPTLETEENEQKIPQLEFPAHVKINSSVLSEAIEDADIIGESVSFKAEHEKFTVTAEGDQNRVIVEVKADDNTKIDTKEPVKSKYSVEYLKKMTPASKLAETVVIKFNKDYPLMLDYKVVDRIALSFILAPRVENE